MPLPYDGAITRFFEQEAPEEVRATIREAKEGDILDRGYPHAQRMPRKPYHERLEALQIELGKMQAWVRKSGARIAIVFEGRDAAGKGGTIKRFREHLNPRGARLVALGTPSGVEKTQWYFQRYIEQLPAGGEIVFYDRSWYNRGVVEKVFGFCTEAERTHFFHQVTDFERMLVQEGIYLFKFWLNVGRAEQLRRFLSRERSPLKQWKLSHIDVEGLKKWDAYSTAIGETLGFSHTVDAPWTVIRADDKRRARIETLRHVLGHVDYAGKDARAVGTADTLVCGGPEIWDG